ncbi:MAG: HAMP domain-containing sensor histidine kinase [Bacilli bacterium]
MKKDILNLILMAFICFTFTSCFTFLIINDYKNILMNNTANITNKLVEKYPHLESEIIEILDDSNSNNDLHLLNKYGIEKSTILSLSDFDSFKERTILISILFCITILTLFIIIYTKKSSKDLKHKKKLEMYIKSILNDDFNFNFADYNESDESVEINNIYKLTTKLKKQRDVYYIDKNNLEIVLSDISHQLKTPLTSLFVINELLLNDKLNSNDKTEFITKSNSQLKRIEWLVTSLLKIAKMDSKTITFKKEECNLFKLLNNIKEELLINFELKNQNLIINCEKDIMIISDYNWLKEAIFNVIKNAHEHGYENNDIIVTVSNNPLYSEIIILNQGETIDKEDLNNLFKRFYKGKNSSISSIGIGLNMTKSILDNNNGVIKVESENNITSFTIKLYKNIK